MICALTVRKLKSGTFEDFRAAFMRDQDPDSMPEGWVRFDMVRNVEDPDEVVCFGFFDGTVEEIRRQAAEQNRTDQLEGIAPFVESVGADGLYEIVEDIAVAAQMAD